MTEQQTAPKTARRDAQIAYMVAVDRMIRAADEAKRERDRLLALVRDTEQAGAAR